MSTRINQIVERLEEAWRAGQDAPDPQAAMLDAIRTAPPMPGVSLTVLEAALRAWRPWDAGPR